MNKSPLKTYISISLLAIVIIVVAIFLLRDNVTPVKELSLTDVQKLITEGHLTKAESQLYQLQKENPNNKDIPALLGTIKLIESKPEEAIKHLEEAFSYGNRDQAVLLKLGECYLLTGKTDKLKTGIKEVNNSVTTYFEALLAINDKKPQEALEKLKSIEIDLKDYYPYQVNIGDCYHRLHKHDEAVGHYKKALGQQPNLWHVALKLSDYYLEKSDEQQALKYSNRAIKAFDYCLPAFKRGGEIFFKMKLYDEAKKYFSHYAKISDRKGLEKNCAYANFRMSNIETIEKNYDKAYEYIKKAAEKNPKELNIVESAATLALQFEDFEEAVKYSNLALVINNESGYSHFIKGSAHKASGDIVSAIVDLKKAVEHLDDSNKAKLMLSDILLQQNELKDAYSYLSNVDESTLSNNEKFSLRYNKAAVLLRFEKVKEAQELLKIISEMPTLTLNQAVQASGMCARLNQMDFAKKFADIAIKIAPGNIRSQYVLAMVHYINKDYKGAVKAFEDIKVGRHNDDTRFLCGMSYHKSGNNEEAQKVLAPLLEDSKYSKNKELHEVFK